MFLNKVFLIGNLTRKPEIRQTSTGKTVASFSIAVNERRGQTEETLFIKITVWERQAEIAERYLDKGSLVLVEGRLRIEEYETRDGQKRRDPVVVANQITLGPKGASGGGGQGRQQYGEPSARDESASYESDNPRRREEDAGDYSYGGQDAAEKPSGSGNGGGDKTEDDLPF